MENPINMDDLGGPPLFLETPIFSRENKVFQLFFFRVLSENLNAERPQRCGYLEIWTSGAFRVSYTLGRFSLILILGCVGCWKFGSMVIGSMGYFTDPYKWGILELQHCY